MDFIYFIKVLYRNKWWILGFSLLSALAALVIKINTKPFYASTAQYSTGFTAEKVRLTGTAAVDLFGAEVKFNNVIETIKSPGVVSMVSYKLMLHDLQNPSKKFRKITGKDLSKPGYTGVNADSAIKILSAKLEGTDLLNSASEKEKRILEYLKIFKYDYNSLLDNLIVKRVDRTDYLDIVFLSENPELSALVVNALGEEFLNYFKRLSNERTAKNATVIKSLMEGEQKRVADLSGALLNEKISQGTIDPVSRSTSAMETVKELEAKLADEKSTYNIHAYRLAYLKEQLSTLQAGQQSANGGGNNADIISLTNKKNELLAELSRKGGNDAGLQQQINDIRNQIVTRSGGSDKKKLIESLNTQISEETALMNAAGTTIAAYTASISRYMGLTNVNPGSKVKMDAIQTQLDIENNQLKNIKEKFSQVEGLVQDDPTSNFIQTRIGQPALEPLPKKTILITLLAAASMFLISSLIFIFLEIFDTAVKMPSVFAKSATVGISAILNHINLKGNNISDVIFSEDQANKFSAISIFKNNIRKLRHEVINSGKKVVLITSAQQGAGKSTTIEALAASLLLSGKKILLIDLNFKNNTLTRVYNATTLIQDINSNTSSKNIDSKIDERSLLSSREGLYIIGCKTGDTTPAEVLNDTNMRSLLQQFAHIFDFIIMEGAALNEYSDSREIAQYAELIFTVFSASSSLSQPDITSFQFLKDQKEKNAGVIFNNVLKENINS